MVRRGSTVRVRQRALQKVQHVAAFAFSPTCRVRSVRWVWSRLWSFRVQNGVAPKLLCPLLERAPPHPSAEPSAAGTSPAATAPALPPLEPPQTRSSDHGLHARPKCALVVV